MRAFLRFLILSLMISVIAIAPASLDAQSMGSVVIVQGGNSANVTAGHALQVDLFSTGGTTFSGATSGSLPVTIVSGGGSGGTSAVDEATFTPGTTAGTYGNCFFQTTATNNNLTNLQGGTQQCTARRAAFENLDAVGATAVSTGNGTSGAGDLRVNIASDNTAFQVKVLGNAGGAFDAATGAAPPANAVLMGGLGSGATGGFVTAIPVSDTTKSTSITTATTTLLITGASGRQVRVGSYELYTSGADNVEFIEGTGATCGTGTTGMIGGATTGLSMSFGAAGGVVHGSGLGTVLQTATSGDSVCLVTSANVNLGINLQYTIY